MTTLLSTVRESCWSELCNTDGQAYSRYLETVQSFIDHGFRFIAAGERHGTRDIPRSGGCGFDNDVRFILEGNGGGVVRTHTVVGSVAIATGVVDTEDNGDSGIGAKGLGVAGCGISGGSFDVGVDRVVCLGDATLVQRADERRGDAEFDAGTVGRTSAEVLSDNGGGFESRGKHWKKNQVRRQRRKAARLEAKSERDKVPEWRRNAGAAHVGVFSRCSESVQSALRESQARMLTAKNEFETAKALAAKRRMDSEQRARLDELQFELDRMKFDKERKEMIEKHLASLPAGYAETLASAGIDSGVPSLSDGSVSPSSSISMAEVQAMYREIASLKEQVAFDAAEFMEEKVKLEARLRLQKELSDEALAVEKAKYDQLNRVVCSEFDAPKRLGTRVYGGNGYSSWSK